MLEKLPDLIDTHAHLYDEAFSLDLDSIIVRSKEAGVSKVFVPNVDLETVEPLHNLCEQNPGFAYPMLGLHPCSVKDDFNEKLEILRNYSMTRKYYAVGEIGIDLYWDKTTYDIQKQAFKAQASWANEMDLPVIIHSRESIAQLIDILSVEIQAVNGGIFHCFTGTTEEAEKILGMGFYLGIGGVVTFKNSLLPSVLKEIGPDKLVLETDSPYLAPTPHRGKRNESGYIHLVASKLAEIFESSVSEIAEITTTNALKVFRMAQ